MPAFHGFITPFLVRALRDNEPAPNPYEGCQGVSLSWWVCGFGGGLGFFGTYPLRVRTELFSG